MGTLGQEVGGVAINKGLYALALANTGERFGYYTMLAVFALFLRANFGLTAGEAGMIYASFLGFVYFLPLIGGILADKIGYGKCVTIGIIIPRLRAAGYPTGRYRQRLNRIADDRYVCRSGAHQFGHRFVQR